MPLQVRRGTNSQRTALSGVKIPAAGELLFTTDTKLLYVGDGTTVGGVPVGNGNLPANTGNLVEGSNLYYTDARVRSAISLTDAGGAGAMTYNSSTGVFTYNGPSASDSNIVFNGSGNIGLNSKIILKNNEQSNSRDQGIDGVKVRHETGITTYSFNDFISINLPNFESSQYAPFNGKSNSLNIGKFKGFTDGENNIFINDELMALYPHIPSNISSSPYSNYFYFNSKDDYTGIETNPITISNCNKFTILFAPDTGYSTYGITRFSPGYFDEISKSKEKLLLILSAPSQTSTAYPVNYIPNYNTSDPILIYRVIGGLYSAGSNGARSGLTLSIEYMGGNGITNTQELISVLPTFNFPTGYNQNTITAKGIRLTLCKESNLGVSVKGPLRLDSLNKDYDNMSGKIVFPDNTVQTTAYQVVTAPTTATSSGITGQIAYDSNYVYICTATNTWKRSALSSW